MSFPTKFSLLLMSSRTPPPDPFSPPPPPGGNYPPGTPLPPVESLEKPPNFDLSLALSLINLILCCNVFLGIPALIFSIMAKNEFKRQQFQDAAQKNKISMILSYVSFGLTALAIFAYIAFFIFIAVSQRH